MNDHASCAICGADMGTGRRCPVHGTPEQVAVELHQNRDAGLSRLRVRVAELEEAADDLFVACTVKDFDAAQRIAKAALASRSGLVAVERDRLREVQWIIKDAIIRDARGKPMDAVMIRRCPVCHRIEPTRDSRLQHVSDLFGHAPGCWLGRLLA